ncbi:neurobeachin-like protein 1 isoform X1, partial [Tachysurus ichikawai]
LCSIFELLLNLLQTSVSCDQLFLLLFEPGMADSCYALLLNHKHSDRLRELIFKLFERMLRCDRVYEKSKQRLRLREVGYSGLTLLIPDLHITPTLVKCLLNQILHTDTVVNYKDLMALVQLTHRADLSVRMLVCKRLYSLVQSQADAALQISRQPCWQDTLIRVLVRSCSGDSGSGSGRCDTASLGSVGSSRAELPVSVESLEENGEVLSLTETPSETSQSRGLRLDLSHVHALEQGDSGSRTPSPLENTKPFPGTAPERETTSSLGDDSFLFNDNVSLGESFNSTERTEEELGRMMLEIVLCVMWKGVSGSDDAAWLERGQVFSALTKLGTANELLLPVDHIKLRLLERMLECAVNDNRDCAAAVLPEHTENAVRLLHVVQDFLQAEGLVNPALWSERLLEETVTLMDGLMVWYTAGTQWHQLSQLGLRLLLGFMAQPDPQ